MIKKFTSKCSEAAVNMLQANGLDCDAEFHGSDLKILTIRLPGIERGIRIDGGSYGSLYFHIPVPNRVERKYRIEGQLLGGSFCEECASMKEAEERLEQINDGLVGGSDLSISEYEYEIWD